MMEYNHTYSIAIFACLPGYGNDVGVVGIGCTPSFPHNLFYLEQISSLVSSLLFPNFDCMFITFLVICVQNGAKLFMHVRNKLEMLLAKYLLSHLVNISFLLRITRRRERYVEVPLINVQTSHLHENWWCPCTSHHDLKHDDSRTVSISQSIRS